MCAWVRACIIGRPTETSAYNLPPSIQEHRSTTPPTLLAKVANLEKQTRVCPVAERANKLVVEVIGGQRLGQFPEEELDDAGYHVRVVAVVEEVSRVGLKGGPELGEAGLGAVAEETLGLQVRPPDPGHAVSQEERHHRVVVELGVAAQRREQEVDWHPKQHHWRQQQKSGREDGGVCIRSRQQQQRERRCGMWRKQSNKKKKHERRKKK